MGAWALYDVGVLGSILNMVITYTTTDKFIISGSLVPNNATTSATGSYPGLVNVNPLFVWLVIACRIGLVDSRQVDCVFQYGDFRRDLRFGYAANFAILMRQGFAISTRMIRQAGGTTRRNEAGSRGAGAGCRRNTRLNGFHNGRLLIHGSAPTSASARRRRRSILSLSSTGN